MKNRFALALAAATLAAAPLSAAPQEGGPSIKRIRLHKINEAAGAPEIDPMLAAGGIALVVGGALVLTTRRRPSTES